jgi:hypothetical protein
MTFLGVTENIGRPEVTVRSIWHNQAHKKFSQTTRSVVSFEESAFVPQWLQSIQLPIKTLIT